MENTLVAMHFCLQFPGIPLLMSRKFLHYMFTLLCQATNTFTTLILLSSFVAVQFWFIYLAMYIAIDHYIVLSEIV